MKTPRVTDFDPNAKEKSLKSPLDKMPTIESPKASNENASIPAIQKAGKPEKQNAGKPVFQNASIPELQQIGIPAVSQNRVPIEKVTYRFHPEARYAVEDMKNLLVRKHGIKASLEEIAENCILIAYEDLLENQNASKLAKKLSRLPENQKSR